MIVSYNINSELISESTRSKQIKYENHGICIFKKLNIAKIHKTLFH